jgi:hypothetical protein
MLQAKRRSVIPAKAGIQGGEEVAITENLDSPLQPKADPSFGGFAGKTERAFDSQSTNLEPLGLKPMVVQLMT